MRLQYVNKLYQILDQLKEQNGDYYYLRNQIPQEYITNAGLYFFFDQNCFREDGISYKIIRIGITRDNGNPRLESHQNGNIVNSIFRKHIGRVFKVNNNLLNNNDLEVMISNYIQDLPYLFIPINDNENLESLEERCIEIISNFQTPNNNVVIDAPPENWIGYTVGDQIHHTICHSHLWLVHYAKNYNENNIDYTNSLNLLQQYIN
jgi:hypothetical protein